MSSLWTPGGERPIRKEPDPSPTGPSGPPFGGVPGGPEPTEEEVRQRMEQARDELSRIPAAEIVAEQAATFGRALFEVAALHLSLERPQLEQAKVAIDTLGELVEKMPDRLGPYAQDLAAAVAQLRMAFVQIQAGAPGSPGGASS